MSEASLLQISLVVTFIFLHPRLYICLQIYICMVYVRPDNLYCAHAHCVCTLTLTPDLAQRKPKTESERVRDCTRLIHALPINKSYSTSEVCKCSVCVKDLAMCWCHQLKSETAFSVFKTTLTLRHCLTKVKTQQVPSTSRELCTRFRTTV